MSDVAELQEEVAAFLAELEEKIAALTNGEQPAREREAQ
jgi:hypothetical protein